MTTNKNPGCAGRRIPGISETCSFNPTDSSAVAQRGRLLAALKTRPLSTLEARREIDVLHPAARVMELRRDGYPIERAWTHDVTSEGYLHRVARYHLSGERAQRELF